MKNHNRENGKKLFTTIFVWVTSIIVIGFIAYGVVLYINPSTQTNTNNPGKSFSILNSNHIKIGASHLPYNSNPPTSGQHYAVPAKWGIYEHELPDEQVVHNLEHGGIWISYKPGIDNAIRVKLEDIGKLNPNGMIISPRSADDSNIAIASWGRLLKLDKFDASKIKLFIKLNEDNSPEQLARFGK